MKVEKKPESKFQLIILFWNFDFFGVKLLFFEFLAKFYLNFKNQTTAWNRLKCMQ
jgi:hypothetical protein